MVPNFVPFFERNDKMPLSYYEETLIQREIEHEAVKQGLKDLDLLASPEFEKVFKTVTIDEKTGKVKGAKEAIGHLKNLGGGNFTVNWKSLKPEDFAKRKDLLMKALEGDSSPGFLPQVDAAELSKDEFKDVEAMLRSSGQTRSYRESVERIAHRQQKENQENA
jgi:hypothetical protein